MNLFLFLLLQHISHAYITVLFPQELKSSFANRYKSGIIPSSIGNFGNPPYGSSITGTLIIEKDSNAKGCYPLPLFQEEEILGNPIIMVDHGDCAFVIKVRNAENIGAKAVIIVHENDNDLDSFIMSDNGAGGNLDIPAILIKKIDGDLIKNYQIEKNQDIMLYLSFDTTIIDKGVDIKIWTQSSSISGMSLLSNLSNILPSLDDLTFIPHYFV